MAPDPSNATAMAGILSTLMSTRPEAVSMVNPTARGQLGCALESALTRTPRVLHVIRERDCGLFSLIQQVVANVPWALHEGRVPVVDFRDRTAYWTPSGYQGRDSVWEYYFEPVVEGLPSAAVPDSVTRRIEAGYPDSTELGFFAGDDAFVSNHFGDHPRLAGIAPAIPYKTGNPDRALREWTGEIIGRFVRPRPFITAKVARFFDAHMRGSEVIGVHVRGTDAVSAPEPRWYRQGSLDLRRFENALWRLLQDRPKAKVFVATDAQASLDRLAAAFGARVLAYDAVRHVEGEAIGTGPMGWQMPAYVTADRETAAQNGEDAVVEYLLLGRCSYLVHNGASLATTVLLRDPDMPHINTRARAADGG
jgi:hypothetical protein